MYILDVFILVFFFFKQKTAYEMRISDWSSDVCSSDLAIPQPPPRHVTQRSQRRLDHPPQPRMRMNETRRPDHPPQPPPDHPERRLPRPRRPQPGTPAPRPPPRPVPPPHHTTSASRADHS